MTASAGFATEVPTSQEQPKPASAGVPAGMAGFVSAHAAPVKKGHLTGPDMDVVDHLERIKNGEDAATVAPKSKLAEDFDNTRFMELLAMIYGIRAIPTEYKAQLESFKLDNARPLPQTYNDTLYALCEGVSVEITKDSVLADEAAGPMTPALAYKLAAAAAANPAMKTLTLSGNDEDRAMLFWAAKHFDLDVTDESIPEIAEDKIGVLAEKFHVFEQAAGLSDSKVEKYLGQPAETAKPDAKATQPKPERREPTLSPFQYMPG
ncbi:MAG: hypothetical protein HYS17_05560 [Micavibrio aeruginosavorus]|uniref:Uncharacterized protein n=1 Tax=Micavibrio aeruginosavorus TaxID=349221 RepID=A0A7T5R462_9BACT|nr:MAG: hypothetical protein HYS17_05560 [Micavibrio aeruginosavorus]